MAMCSVLSRSNSATVRGSAPAITRRLAKVWRRQCHTDDKAAKDVIHALLVLLVLVLFIPGCGNDKNYRLVSERYSFSVEFPELP
jgi:hypothetical protein